MILYWLFPDQPPRTADLVDVESRIRAGGPGECVSIRVWGSAVRGRVAIYKIMRLNGKTSTNIPVSSTHCMFWQVHNLLFSIIVLIGYTAHTHMAGVVARAPGEVLLWWMFERDLCLAAANRPGPPPC